MNGISGPALNLGKKRSQIVGIAVRGNHLPVCCEMAPGKWNGGKGGYVTLQSLLVPIPFWVIIDRATFE